MIRRIVCLLLACLLPACAVLAGEETAFFQFSSGETAPPAMEGYHVYVDPAGDDQAPGTLEAPLRTLQAAIRQVGYSASGEAATIWLRGGTHVLQNTLAIHGEAFWGLSIRGYPGEEAVITGAVEVSGWVETVYKGGLVWVTPLSALQPRTLFDDDGLLQSARWPKGDGTLPVLRSESAAKDKFTSHNGFYVDAAQIPAALEGTVVRLLHWWKDELAEVRAYSPLTGYLEMTRPSSMSIEKGDRYWLENVLDMPLDPGEWAYDAANGLLYYAPRGGEMIGEKNLYAGITEKLLQVYGVYGITFEDVTFARTTWSIPHGGVYADFQQAAYDAESAVVVTDSRNVRFAGCTFRDIGAGAIRLDQNVKDAEIYNCTFRNIGAQAVYIFGANTTFDEYVTERITLENNEIRGWGKTFYNAAGILIIHARDIDILHNDISGGTYTGISAGWVWGDGYNVTNGIRIYNNLLYNIGQGQLSDMGAIYLLGSQPNSYIASNVIHDVNAYDYGGWGIYLDEGSSGIIVENNLVYRCSAQGYHQHYGNDNIIRNNIFALNRDGQVGASGKGSFILEGNIIVGAKPHLNREAGMSITTRSNTYRETADVFVDADGSNFNLSDDPTLLENGFRPFVFFAGRYAQLY